MRNLLGRLNARSTDELTRIATAWRVPVTAEDRAGLAGQLYRALSDPRTVRDAWDQLDGDEQALVRLLAVGDEAARTLASIAGELDMPETNARQTATRLYHKGILAREGDDDPLPVGVAPRLFLPRELGLLFRRVQDEIEAGDLSTTPLRALLSLLDDTEIEEAGQIWGLKVIPGLREREELSRRLLEQAGDAGRVARVAGERRRDAALIWRRLLDQDKTETETETKPVPLAEAAVAAGLAGRDAREAKRLREALAELERALLVWHTYRKDGSRWLFIPAEIRAPRRPEPTDLPPLTPLAALTVDRAAWRHPHALAWDLLATLRDLTRARAPRLHLDSDLPRPWKRRLGARLWTRRRQGEGPPDGYIEFLLALAVAEGLLSGGGGAEEPLQVTAAIRRWRDRSFAEQTDRLCALWLESGEWIEGAAREDVQVWGADWRGFRHKLIGRLGALGGAGWYPLDAVTAWLAAADPEMLGSTFTAATARHMDRGDDRARRRAAIAEVATVTLTTGLEWFGMVELSAVPRTPYALRLTPAGLALAGAGAAPIDHQSLAADSRLTVLSDLTITLDDPTPLQVWSVSAFAEPIALDRVSHYRLTPEAVATALDAGFDVAQITAFLARQSRAALPAEVSAALAGWSGAYRRVRLRRALVLSVEDGDILAAIEAAVQEAGYEVSRLGEELVVELMDKGTESDPERVLTQLLSERGFTPHWTRSATPGGGDRHS